MTDFPHNQGSLYACKLVQNLAPKPLSFKKKWFLILVILKQILKGSLTFLTLNHGNDGILQNKAILCKSRSFAYFAVFVESEISGSKVWIWGGCRRYNLAFKAWGALLLWELGQTVGCGNLVTFLTFCSNHPLCPFSLGEHVLHSQSPTLFYSHHHWPNSWLCSLWQLFISTPHCYGYF